MPYILLQALNLACERDERMLFKGLNLTVKAGEIWHIKGPNGAGKTSLLRLMIGDLYLDSGELDVKPGVQIGYFHQDHRTLDFTLTPEQQIQKMKPKMPYGDLRALLGQFQFTPSMVKNPLSKLSGGERARVAILKLLLEDNNLLLLDEPTNHLDADARGAVEESLKEYDGAIISVSHDRWFLNQVCDTIWELKGDGSLKVWPGNYSEYIRRSQVG